MRALLAGFGFGLGGAAWSNRPVVENHDARTCVYLLLFALVLAYVAGRLGRRGGATATATAVSVAEAQAAAVATQQVILQFGGERAGAVEFASLDAGLSWVGDPHPVLDIDPLDLAELDAGEDELMGEASGGDAVAPLAPPHPSIAPQTSPDGDRAHLDHSGGSHMPASSRTARPEGGGG